VLLQVRKQSHLELQLQAEMVDAAAEARLVKQLVSSIRDRVCKQKQRLRRVLEARHAALVR
jgi:hypothetical protein